jgi:hypothetical protein
MRQKTRKCDRDKEISATIRGYEGPFTKSTAVRQTEQEALRYLHFRVPKSNVILIRRFR